MSNKILEKIDSIYKDDLNLAESYNQTIFKSEVCEKETKLCIEVVEDLIVYKPLEGVVSDFDDTVHLRHVEFMPEAWLLKMGYNINKDRALTIWANHIIDAYNNDPNYFRI